MFMHILRGHPTFFKSAFFFFLLFILFLSFFLFYFMASYQEICGIPQIQGEVAPW